MATQNVSLSERQSRFVRQSVRGGKFRNASEVIRAGLRLLEQQEQIDRLKLKALRRISKEAFKEIDRGDYVEVNAAGIDDFLDSVIHRGKPANLR